MRNSGERIQEDVTGDDPGGGIRCRTLPEASVLFPDGDIIDTGVPFFHQPVVIEFPVLIAISAVPLARRIMKFIFEADSNAVAGEGPEFLFKFIVQFVLPFAGEELNDFFSAVEEFGAVAPLGVGGVGERYFFGVTGIPGVFCQLNFLSGGFGCERRKWGPLFHDG